MLRDDFKRLWATNFLDNLWIEVKDQPYANGVVGKHVIFHMEERPRVKIVDYTGSSKIERTKVDEKMKEANVSLRLDSFLDQGAIRRVEGILRGLMAEKGYQFAEVKSHVEALPGGPKLVKVVFDVNEGPKVKVRDIEFVGNHAFSDGTLKRKMKETKEQWFLSLITGRGTYQEAKFEEDAEKVETYYREQGYVQARVGQPEIKTLEDSKDKETRWVQLRIPVTEGATLPGRRGHVRGQQGHRQQVPAPAPQDSRRASGTRRRTSASASRRRARSTAAAATWSSRVIPNTSSSKPAEGPVAGPAESDRQRHDAAAGRRAVLRQPHHLHRQHDDARQRDPARDAARRRRRLQHRGAEVQHPPPQSARLLPEPRGVVRTTSTSRRSAQSKNEVDVTLKLQEQNRNQLTFGAGVSQFEGFFGQLSFQTSNFLGRGESLTLSLQAGSRAENYQVAFTEPFLFDRNITGGVDVYKRSIQYIGQFTQKSIGGNLMFGFPVSDFGRMFMTYSYEGVRRHRPESASYQDPRLIANNPFLQDSLLIGQGGKRTVSKVTPSYVFNTIDNPIFPNTGPPRLAVERLRRPRRQHQLHQAARSKRSASSATPAARRSPSAARSNTSAVRQHGASADLRAAVPRRRVQHSWLRHPHGRSARPDHQRRASAATRACCSTPNT